MLILLIAFMVGALSAPILLNKGRLGLPLLAAIPAAVFYNKLSADVDRVLGGYESFADEFATILSRQLDA